MNRMPSDTDLPYKLMLGQGMIPLVALPETLVLFYLLFQDCL